MLSKHGFLRTIEGYTPGFKCCLNFRALRAQNGLARARTPTQHRTQNFAVQAPYTTQFWNLSVQIDAKRPPSLECVNSCEGGWSWHTASVHRRREVNDWCTKPFRLVWAKPPPAERLSMPVARQSLLGERTPVVPKLSPSQNNSVRIAIIPRAMSF
jgi:hypothetical protein